MSWKKALLVKKRVVSERLPSDRCISQNDGIISEQSECTESKGVFKTQSNI